MTELETAIQNWQRQGHSVEVKNAPKGAITFDKMLVVHRKPEDPLQLWLGAIRAVHFYDSKLDKFVADF